MSITSFYGSHIINCAGNGGALTINDKKVMEKAKLLRSGVEALPYLMIKVKLLRIVLI